MAILLVSRVVGLEDPANGFERSKKRRNQDLAHPTISFQRSQPAVPMGARPRPVETSPTVLQMAWTHDCDDPPGAPAETIVDREQSAAENAGKGDVFGVVGLRPTELFGDALRLSAGSMRCAGGNRRGEQRVESGRREPF